MKKFIVILLCLFIGSVAWAENKVISHPINYGRTILSIDRDAVALDVGLNAREEPVIYYLEDTSGIKRRRFIQMVERGHEAVSDGYAYVGMINFENVIIYFVFEKE